MSTHVEESVDVNLPVSTVYNQWTQFEEFPQFMSGVASVTQLSEDRLEWVAEICRRPSSLAGQGLGADP